MAYGHLLWFSYFSGFSLVKLALPRLMMTNLKRVADTIVGEVTLDQEWLKQKDFSPKCSAWKVKV